MNTLGPFFASTSEFGRITHFYFSEDFFSIYMWYIQCHFYFEKIWNCKSMIIVATNNKENNGKRNSNDRISDKTSPNRSRITFHANTWRIYRNLFRWWWWWWSNLRSVEIKWRLLTITYDCSKKLCNSCVHIHLFFRVYTFIFFYKFVDFVLSLPLIFTYVSHSSSWFQPCKRKWLVKWIRRYTFNRWLVVRINKLSFEYDKNFLAFSHHVACMTIVKVVVNDSFYVSKRKIKERERHVFSHFLIQKEIGWNYLYGFSIGARCRVSKTWLMN